MPGGRSKKAGRGQVREVIALALLGLSLGACRASVPLRGAPVPDPPFEARKIDFAASGCSQLEVSCSRDGERIICPRGPFAAGLAGCIDLWEERELCATAYSSAQGLYAFERQGYEDLLEQMDAASARGAVWRWVWAGAAFVSGIAVGVGVGVLAN